MILEFCFSHSICSNVQFLEVSALHVNTEPKSYGTAARPYDIHRKPSRASIDSRA